MQEVSQGEVIGKTLRATREARLFSREELAKRSGVAHITIATIELGRVDHPRRRTIERLAAPLGITADAIIDGTGEGIPKAEAPPLSEKERRRRERLEEIREAYREAREGVVGYCDAWERRLAEGEPDRELVREFLSAAHALFRTLTDSLVSELEEISKIVGTTEDDDVSDEMRSESGMVPVFHRYCEIGRRVEAVWLERFADGADNVVVIDFEARQNEVLRRVA